jgi:hypothetical protein
MRTQVAAAAVIAAGFLAGCSSAGPSLPACSAGHGNGHTATLATHQDGDHFTGTYLTPVPGGTDLRYDVQGTARGGHLTSVWSVGAVALPVTGTYTPATITLDNPGGQFSITRFSKSTGCPAG